MIRNVIRIDEERCDGCGICANACVEGAIAIVNGKARLVSDTYCDGLGVCIGECPQGAITMEAREAPAFDEAAAKQHAGGKVADLPCGCPGAHVQTIAARSGDRALQSNRNEVVLQGSEAQVQPPSAEPSALANWPVQIRLVPPSAPFLMGADLVVCADCVPFAVPDFHRRYLDGRVVLVGCPKLDDVAADQQKLTAILNLARPKSVTVLRMEVPCCGGIVRAVVAARNATIPDLPIAVHTIGIRSGVEVDTL